MSRSAPGETETDELELLMKRNHSDKGLFGSLPINLRRRIGLPPKSGDGVHRWIYKAACVLKTEYRFELTFRIILGALRDCGRNVPDCEVINAIRDAGNKIGDTNSCSNEWGNMKTKWPDRDAALVTRLLKDAPSALEHFRSKSCAMSAGEELTTEKVIDQLFPGDPFLCVGQSIAGMRTHPKSWWLQLGLKRQFIVPSPMTASMGLNQAGKPSHRCLNNSKRLI